MHSAQKRTPELQQSSFSASSGSTGTSVRSVLESLTPKLERALAVRDRLARVARRARWASQLLDTGEAHGPSGPAFAPMPECLPAPGLGNRDVHPAAWGMTLKQWNTFLAACRRTEAWKALERKKGYVNLFDLNEHFVKPWTRGTGASIALRMNPATPLEANLMISHSWAEDIDECAQALNCFCSRQGLGEDAVVWFCLFAQYQPGDEEGDPGPTVAEQLCLDPFGCVVRHVCKHRGMVVIHTSRAEVYDRLWCVKEISEALRTGCPIEPACSLVYVEASKGHLLDMVKVKTRKARCSMKRDEVRIRTEVRLKGGFRRLDKEILSFRLDMLRTLAEERARKECAEADLPLAIRDEFERAELELVRLSRIVFLRHTVLVILVVIFVLMVAGAVVPGVLSELHHAHTHLSSPTTATTSASPTTLPPAPIGGGGWGGRGGSWWAQPPPAPATTTLPPQDGAPDEHHRTWTRLLFVCSAAAVVPFTGICGTLFLGRKLHGHSAHVSYLKELVREKKMQAQRTMAMRQTGSLGSRPEVRAESIGAILQDSERTLPASHRDRGVDGEPAVRVVQARGGDLELGGDGLPPSPESSDIHTIRL